MNQKVESSDTVGRIFVLFAEGDAVTAAHEVVKQLVDRIGSNESVPIGSAHKALAIDSTDDELPPEEIEGDDPPTVAATRAPAAKECAGDDYMIKVLRAVEASDGRSASIAKALGATSANYQLDKYCAAGLIQRTGQSRATRWTLTDKGRAEIAKINGAAASGSEKNSWTTEQQRLYVFLTSLGRPCRITDAMDELGFSKKLFERASVREEFTVKGDLVELTP